jgi:co-chaperonin GroES (HSP10)
MPVSNLKVIGEIHPLPDDILVINMERGEKVTRGGLIIIDDNGKNRGIRPRWAQVYKVGSNARVKLKDTVEEGQWIYVEHGRWTYGVEFQTSDQADGESIYVQKIDLEAVLAVSDECPFT